MVRKAESDEETKSITYNQLTNMKPLLINKKGVLRYPIVFILLGLLLPLGGCLDDAED